MRIHNTPWWFPFHFPAGLRVVAFFLPALTTSTWSCCYSTQLFLQGVYEVELAINLQPAALFLGLQHSHWGCSPCRRLRVNSQSPVGSYSWAISAWPRISLVGNLCLGTPQLPGQTFSKLLCGPGLFLPDLLSFTGARPALWFEGSPHLLLLPSSLSFAEVFSIPLLHI